MSNRIKRVSLEIQYLINKNMKEILSFHTDLLQSMITVTRVSMSKDLKIANCYILQSSNIKLEIDVIMKKFKKLSPIFRDLINGNMRLRSSPQIKFIYDYGVIQSMKIEKLLDDIKGVK